MFCGANRYIARHSADPHQWQSRKMVWVLATFCTPHFASNLCLYGWQGCWPVCRIMGTWRHSSDLPQGGLELPCAFTHSVALKTWVRGLRSVWAFCDRETLSPVCVLDSGDMSHFYFMNLNTYVHICWFAKNVRITSREYTVQVKFIHLWYVYVRA